MNAYTITCVALSMHPNSDSGARGGQPVTLLKFISAVSTAPRKVLGRTVHIKIRTPGTFIQVRTRSLTVNAGVRTPVRDLHPAPLKVATGEQHLIVRDR